MDQNMNKPKISVLMPVYNAEKYLREAIESILNQTFKDFEFIIINDASTDSSKKIIIFYKDQRIKYFENTHNLGVAKTLNKGLELATAKYIARMDADDISSPQRLAIEYGQIIKDNNIALVASSYETIDQHGKYIYTVNDVSSAEEIFYTLQFRNCLGHPTVIFNKEIILREFHGYKNCQAEDYDLWLRVSKKYKISKINKVLHQLRISDTSRVSRFNIAIKNNALKIAQNNLQTLISKPINIKFIKIFANLNSFNYSSQNIKEILKVLNDVNAQIFGQCPHFLIKEYLIKIIKKKTYFMWFRMILSPVLESWAGSIIRRIYRLVNSCRYKVSSRFSILFVVLAQ